MISDGKRVALIGNKRIRLVGKATLKIMDIQPEDEGWYTCEASDNSNHVTRSKAYLKVMGQTYNILYSMVFYTFLVEFLIVIGYVVISRPVEYSLMKFVAEKASLHLSTTIIPNLWSIYNRPPENYNDTLIKVILILSSLSNLWADFRETMKFG